ncbi:MAG: hypothetical protein JRD89_09865 [Deltaproteobacteria bacterium]|nr:hypothetical protein [Deltaproteobacteria bacterium]
MLKTWGFGQFKRREVIAPVATPWEALGLRKPKRIRRKEKAVVASKPEQFFVFDQKMMKAESKRQAASIMGILEHKKRIHIWE